MSLIALARLANELIGANEIDVSEGGGSDLAFSNVPSVGANKLVAALRELGWPFVVEDASDSIRSDAGELDSLLEPFLIQVQKPATERWRFLTLEGFTRWLENPTVGMPVEVALCSRQFLTGGFIVSNWDEESLRANSGRALKSPRELVREIHSLARVPQDIRPYLLEPGERIEWGNPVFEAWARVSSCTLAASIASSVSEDGRLRFAGPPIIETQPCINSDFSQLGDAGFRALQAAAYWVYEAPHESETKHTFLAAEVARSPGAIRNGLPYELFNAGLESALVSARLAFQVSLSGIGRDTIQALSELRKTLADEASKLAESARQIGTAVAGAVFISLGVVLAKVTTSVPQWVVKILAVAVVAYLVSMLASAYLQLKYQKNVRTRWRVVLYRFLSDKDYQHMVLDPATQAQLPVNISLVLGIIVAALLGLALWFLPAIVSLQ